MEVSGFVLVLMLLSYFSVCANKVEEVLCVHWKSCVLPCRFTPRNQTINEISILWTKRDRDIIIGHFYDSHHHYKQYHPSYRERTFFFEPDISIGNASLLLREVAIQDEGGYLCLANGQVNYVNVKVHAPVSAVYIDLKDKEVICRAYRVYPRPEVKWTPAPASDPVTSIDRSKGGWFSVFSSVPLGPQLQYSCNVSTAHSWKSHTYSRDTGESIWFWLPALLLGLIILVGCSVTVLIIMRRRIQDRRSKSEAMSKDKTDPSGEPSAGGGESVVGPNPEEKHLEPNDSEEAEQKQILRNH